MSNNGLLSEPPNKTPDVNEEIIINYKRGYERNHHYHLWYIRPFPK